MSVVSIRRRLERAIEKLPTREPRTREQIDTMILSVGGNSQAIWDWVSDNPSATDRDFLKEFSSQMITVYSPAEQWNDAQIDRFFAWRAEQSKPVYFRS